MRPNEPRGAGIHFGQLIDLFVTGNVIVRLHPADVDRIED